MPRHCRSRLASPSFRPWLVLGAMLLMVALAVLGPARAGAAQSPPTLAMVDQSLIDEAVALYDDAFHFSDEPAREHGVVFLRRCLETVVGDGASHIAALDACMAEGRIDLEESIPHGEQDDARWLATAVPEALPRLLGLYGPRLLELGEIAPDEFLAGQLARCGAAYIWLTPNPQRNDSQFQQAALAFCVARIARDLEQREAAHGTAPPAMPASTTTRASSSSR